jgi:hypothetical protein
MGGEPGRPDRRWRGSNAASRTRCPAVRWVFRRRGFTSGDAVIRRCGGNTAPRWRRWSRTCSRPITVRTGRRGSPPICGRWAGEYRPNTVARLTTGRSSPAAEPVVDPTRTVRSGSASPSGPTTRPTANHARDVPSPGTGPPDGEQWLAPYNRIYPHRSCDLS